MRFSIVRSALYGLGSGVFLLACLFLYDIQRDFDEMQHEDVRADQSFEFYERPSVGDGDSATVHVCLCADSHSILGVVATINSVQQNTNHHIMFHIFTTEDAISHLRLWFHEEIFKNTSYQLIKFDPSELQQIITVRESRKELANPMNYVRFYYSRLLPNVHGRVVHLDSDCIVQGDINELASAHMEPNHILATVSDCVSISKRFEKFAPVYNSYINFMHPAVQQLNLNPTSCAFNVGIYVVDLDEWRKQGISKQLEYWLKLNTREPVYGVGAAGGGSQPPMMIALYNKTSFIADKLWHIRGLGLKEARGISQNFLEHGKLLHWSGPFKPWTAKGQFKSYWYKYHVPDPLDRFIPVNRDWKGE